MASRYFAEHQFSDGPGDGRPTATQIVKKEAMEEKLIGSTVFITGCASGIGVETARALFLPGANLYLATRNLQTTKVALKDIIHSERVHLLDFDIESLESVRSCAAEVLSRNASLDILICNAGAMATPEGRTKDGFETQIGTNHLAHFLLFKLLKPVLLKVVTR